MERTILYATDLSGDDAAGLRHASAFARDRNASLVIAHVIELIAADGEPLLLKTLRLDSAVLWRRLRKLVPPDLSVPYRHLLETGDPERVLCDLARRERAELLVLEARRRSPLRGLFGADLLEKLRRSAPCPVLSFRSGHEGAGAGRHEAVEAAAKPEPLGVLRNTLEAKVTALGLWFDAQLAAARTVAGRASLREPIAELVAQGEEANRGDAERALRAELEPLSRALGGLGFLLFDGAGTLRVDGVEASCGVCDDAEREAFVRRVLQHGAAVSRPFALRAEEERERSVMLAAASVPLGEGAQRPVLALCVDAERDFLRILSIPGPGATTETYAFDPSGLMLSFSRFPEQLRRVGLLRRHSREQSALRLRVCDPGGNLLTGFRPGVSPELLPLTRMAERAISGVAGFDLTGYRDYRGVEVVGAWHWMKQHQLGVAAEMDVSEAF